MLIDVDRDDLLRPEGGQSLSCGQGIAAGAVAGGLAGAIGGSPGSVAIGALFGEVAGAALFCRL